MQFLYIDILPNKNIFHSILCTYTFLYAVFSTTKTKSFTLREKPKFTPPPLGSLQHSFYQISITLRGWWWVMKEDARTDWFWIRAILVGVSWWEKTVVPFHHHQLILISPLFFFFSLHQSTVLCFYLLRLPPYFQLYYSPLKYQYVIIENEC